MDYIIVMLICCRIMNFICKFCVNQCKTQVCCRYGCKYDDCSVTVVSANDEITNRHKPFSIF